jgi:tRNA (cmo5U34)-methyltransferase
MKKDTLFKEKKDRVPAFEFNENVVHVFDDMITRSVPLYEECVHRQAQLAARFYQKGTRIYDLGCSHGNFGIQLHCRMKDTAFAMVAVDSSQPMLDQYNQRLRGKNLKSSLSLVCDFVEKIPITNASVVVLNLTLQFIAPGKRDDVIQSIYQGLKPGGLLLITEKIIHDTVEIDSLQQHFYKKFKRENGYSDLEISQKRDALEDVLVPDTLRVHEDRLTQAGFTKMDTWLKWFNFAAMLAIK